MSGERYFLEAWMPGAREDLLIDAADSLSPGSHAHITFGRPFYIPDGKEERIKEMIVNFCIGRGPINFELEGQDSFGETINYIPIKGKEIEEFNRGLEELLAGEVQFVEKISDKKILHLTLTTRMPKPFPKTEATVKRLTCIRDKKIWFSFDFETQEVLNREQSLGMLK